MWSENQVVTKWQEREIFKNIVELIKRYDYEAEISRISYK